MNYGNTKGQENSSDYSAYTYIMLAMYPTIFYAKAGVVSNLLLDFEQNRALCFYQK